MTETATIESRRERLVSVCTVLPEVNVSGEQHLSFQVRAKTFAYYLRNHHGDGRIALCCKAYPGDLEALIGFDPVRFYAPAYLGSKGWVGLRLDLPEVDWVQVEERVRIAYRLLAPKQLAAAGRTLIEVVVFPLQSSTDDHHFYTTQPACECTTGCGL